MRRGNPGAHPTRGIAAAIAQDITRKDTVMNFQAISLEDLVTATGGCAPGTRCIDLSHAQQLKNGNGGIVPKLPDPSSHAGQLANGNGGIVPKLPPLSHADQLNAGNGGIVPKL